MAQFDVYELRSDGQLVVDVQADLLGDSLASRLVIPLFEPEFANWPFGRLTPEVRFGGQEYRLGTSLMVGLPKAELTGPVGSVVEYEYAIMNAIDFLLTGT